jgi:hypothetical protein
LPNMAQTRIYVLLGFLLLMCGGGGGCAEGVYDVARTRNVDRLLMSTCGSPVPIVQKVYDYGMDALKAVFHSGTQPQPHGQYTNGQYTSQFTGHDRLALRADTAGSDATVEPEAPAPLLIEETARPSSEEVRGHDCFVGRWTATQFNPRFHNPSFAASRSRHVLHSLSFAACRDRSFSNNKSKSQIQKKNSQCPHLLSFPP